MSSLAVYTFYFYRAHDVRRNYVHVAAQSVWFSVAFALGKQILCPSTVSHLYLIASLAHEHLPK